MCQLLFKGDIMRDRDARTKLFGMWLFQERRRRGFSLRDLSELSGVSSAEIANIEIGKRGPLLDTALLLTDGLGKKFPNVAKKLFA